MNRPNQSSVLALCFLLHLLCAAAEPLKPAQAKLATEAHQVLINYCGKCHGKGGSYSDEMLLDYTELVGGDEPIVVKGKVDESYLYETIADGDMPPKKAKNPIPTDKLALIKRWIDGGAPNWNLAPQQKREFVSMSSVISTIVKDLDKLKAREREFTRYYNLTHLYNAGASEDTLANYRIALSKLVNSLSWDRDIVPPVAIDSEKTILRIDIRDYDWDKPTWKIITKSYPYKVNYSYKSYDQFCHLTTAEIPLLRADWFISKAALPPLYHDILELPKTDKELEKAKLNVNVEQNIQDSPGKKVWRSGFVVSGVSQFNRIVERHRSSYGAYWKSYDFDSNKGPKNILQHPDNFQHAGGEIIFNLPNGLQAYLLTDNIGKRIDKAPVEIVSNRGNPDPVIQNGLTCMSCHTAGMKEFKDRAGELHLAIIKTDYNDVDRKDDLLALYPEASVMNKLVEKDKATFEAAVIKLGGVIGGREPIALLTDRYLEPIDAGLAAAELALTKKEFVNLLNKHEPLKRAGLNALVAGSTVARESWEEIYPTVISYMHLGTPDFNQDQLEKYKEIRSTDNDNQPPKNPDPTAGSDRQRITMDAVEYQKQLKEARDLAAALAAAQREMAVALAAAQREKDAIVDQITTLEKRFKAATEKAERERISRELAEVRKREEAAAKTAEAISLLQQSYKKREVQGYPSIESGAINGYKGRFLKYRLEKIDQDKVIARYKYTRPKRPEIGNFEKAKPLFDSAYHQHKLNNLEKAIDGYREILKLDPGSFVANLTLASSLVLSRKTKTALPIYEVALAIDPRSRDARYLFAEGLHSEKFHIDAVNELVDLIEMHKSDADGHLLLANIYAENLEMPDQAKIHYRKVLELVPTHSQASDIRIWLAEKSELGERMKQIEDLTAQYQRIKSDINVARRLDWRRRGLGHYSKKSIQSGTDSDAEKIEIKLSDDGRVIINGKTIEPEPKKKDD